MINVRSISADELVAFAALSDDAEGVASLVNGLWTDGTGRPDWTLVAEIDGRAIGRLAARSRGFGVDLSDVDTVNAPMVVAMERNGHRSDVRPWHVWAYRRSMD